MGRWGHRLFDGDQDLVKVIGIAKDLAGGDYVHFVWFFSKALINAPRSVQQFYLLHYKLDVQAPPDIETHIRQKLDSGHGDKMLAKYRDCEDNNKNPMFDGDGKYYVIILAALMMMAGAKIKEDDLEHIRKLTFEMVSRETYGLPIGDDGFRGPGKRQMQIALARYRAGTPHNFAEPTCHACGKSRPDNGGTLQKCRRCKNEIAAAWFCNEACRKSFRHIHKTNCGKPRSSGMNTFQGMTETEMMICVYEGHPV